MLFVYNMYVETFWNLKVSQQFTIYILILDLHKTWLIWETFFMSINYIKFYFDYLDNVSKTLKAFQSITATTSISCLRWYEGTEVSGHDFESHYCQKIVKFILDNFKQCTGRTVEVSKSRQGFTIIFTNQTLLWFRI